jgi:putative restriction endonuclease
LRPFSLSCIDGELTFDVHEAGFGRVRGGLPALEAGLGAVSQVPQGVWRLRVSRVAQADALSRLLFCREEAARSASRHWWLNMPPADSHELDGGYLWTPKKSGSVARRPMRLGITSIAPGDILCAQSAGSLATFGIALDRARSSPDPKLTSSDGWLVPVRFEQLTEPLTLKDHLPQFRRPRAAGRSDAYLVEIPERDVQTLRRLLDRQIEALEDRLTAETDGQLLEQAVEEHIWLRTDISPLNKRQLSFARLGKGVFRANVERIENACRVTGILDRRYLRAAHIKPWKDASDAEKLDGANGLLLSPHISHLFKRGHISFADDGALLLSRHLNPYVLKAWNLERPMQPHAFRPEQRPYLGYHRTHVFNRIGGGRRAGAESA